MNIALQRLNRTYLLRTPWTTGRDVVRALGAVQSQDYEGAKWALSQRTAGATDDAIEREFAAGDILRTHVLRPTWHFVDPADIRWMLALTGPRVAKHMAPYDRHLELDDQLFRRSNAAIEKALRDGAALTRTELKGVLSVARIGALGVQRTAHLMMRAELEGLVCSGPRRGKQFTYVLLAHRVPPAPAQDRDEALLELTRRYFRTRSPAKAQDFSWWSGLTMSDVKRGIDMARSELESVTIEGQSYWVLADMPGRTRPSAHLLPNYDEFFIAFRDRSAIGKRLRSVHAVTGGNALIANVIAINGQLVGGWKRTITGESVRLAVNLLARLTPPEQSRLKAAVRRYEAFLGKQVELSGLSRATRTKARSVNA